MGSLCKLLSDISVPSNILKTESIQQILQKSKEYHKSKNENKDIWNKIAQVLWSHLIIGLKKLDDQLLCATCFYSIITLTNLQNFYMTELLKIIDEELAIRTKNNKSMKTYQVISMIYGMFQSFITLSCNENISIQPVLKSTINLLIMMAYEYSQYTFLVFKILKSFKKACGTHCHEILFNEENVIKLLSLVNHNWENPITGVRDLNRSIFHMTISIVDNDMYERILNEINSFYWNKAKYLMLSEIIECNRGDIFFQYHNNKWIDGFIYSLHKPGLVSAGADMYYALLKQINSDDKWCNLFLSQILNVLSGTCYKAIENFNNYWCLITIKKFPTIINKLIQELGSLVDSEQKLYSCLCIMKQGNKLGLIEKNWKSIDDYNAIEISVLCGIEHCTNYIRMLAFDIVCVVQGKSMPTSTEYKLILDFLCNNVNSDCTVLRLSMLNSFNVFLTKLHSLFLNNLMKSNNSHDAENLNNFCRELQEFVANSLNYNGNYQRKITSLKINDIILNCMSEVPRKKKAQTRQSNRTLTAFLKDNENWKLSDEKMVLKLVSFLKDPADDVREVTTRLLLSHYCSELNREALIKSLISDALYFMKSKFFYEISCGQSMFKLITNLVLKQKIVGSQFTKPEDIFYFAYNELISEYKSKTDVMKSIETGKQLHSFINIMIVVLECNLNPHKVDISGIINELRDVLESISNQFSWEQDSSTSSDFSKMTDMVQEIIANSGYNPYNEVDQTKISGLQQIVLNSLWLNVKASCDLSSILIKYTMDDPRMCEIFLTIITHVLESSRHKGAIEAAGAALGRGIHYLTSLPEENEVSEVPYILLRCKLKDLISETNKMSSITRRGAGLSIMVHRIVSNDMKKGKPLFHFFMNTILEVCNKTQDIPEDKRNNMDTENQIDLPKAIYIHFMTRIVTDSSLASDLMFYSTKLAELAFANLDSPHWQIRNAALQLYGALIPRQIGQKKASGTEDETIATVAFDELRTHSPKLWHYIIGQLKILEIGDTIQHHSNLVPILNMFASIAIRYNFTFDANEEIYDEELLKSLIPLLGSQIHTVRRLTAKCIFNIYKFHTIYTKILLSFEQESENFLHGCLILLRLCYKYYSGGDNKDIFLDLRVKYGTILKNCQHSHACKEVYEDIFISTLDFSNVEETLLEMRSNIHKPGVFLWAETKLRKYIDCCTWNEIPQILKLVLQQCEHEKFCALILKKITTAPNVTKEVLLQTVHILLFFENKHCSSIIWQVIYEISRKIHLHNLHVVTLLRNIEDMKGLYKFRYMIPLIARNIDKTANENQLIFVNIVNKLSNFENSDVEMRYIAAVANNELAYHFKNLSDTVKIIVVKCAVLLLQDEDGEVRNLSVNFYDILCGAKLHPYICLNNIMNTKFLQNLFDNPETSIQKVCKELMDMLESNHTVDEYNPFANDSKNIYLESDVLKKLIENLN